MKIGPQSNGGASDCVRVRGSHWMLGAKLRLNGWMMPRSPASTHLSRVLSDLFWGSLLKERRIERRVVWLTTTQRQGWTTPWKSFVVGVWILEGRQPGSGMKARHHLWGVVRAIPLSLSCVFRCMWTSFGSATPGSQGLLSFPPLICVLSSPQPMVQVTHAKGSLLTNQILHNGEGILSLKRHKWFALWVKPIFHSLEQRSSCVHYCFDNSWTMRDQLKAVSFEMMRNIIPMLRGILCNDLLIQSHSWVLKPSST